MPEEPRPGSTLIVGLGNPGAEYARHRHNIGFRVVEALAQAHGLAFCRRKQAQAYVAEGEIEGQRVLLAKPHTFMNRSGRTVGRLLRAHNIPLQQMLVIYDDLDLPLGRLRLRPEGGSGGHKGMRSIGEVLGSQAFARLRVGIGRPPGQLDAADYVLQPFDPEEIPLVAMVVEHATKAVECWLAEGMTAAMDKYNQPFLPEQDLSQEHFA
ncbi:MAG: aminoacyl-tRNA hydrolase [Anaerolineae bacterium]